MNQQDIRHILHTMLALDNGKTYAYSTHDFEDENGRFGWIDRDDGIEINIGEKSSFELMDEPYEGLLCEISLVNRTSLESYGVLETIKDMLRNNAVPFALEDGGVTFAGQNIACVLYIPLESREKVHQLLKNLGVTFEKVKTLNPKNMDQNQIINRVDELLAEGHAINELVGFLSPMFIIPNYPMLVQKGATNIDLAALIEQVAPLSILDNLKIIRDAGIQIDFPDLFSKLDDEKVLDDLPQYSPELIKSGVDPQLIVDRCMRAKGSFVEFISEWLPGLVLAGAQVDAETLVQKLLGDDAVEDLFEADTSDTFLQGVRAVAAANVKLQDYRARRTLYDAPGGKELSINKDGKQATKIFFDPLVLVVGTGATKTLPQNWAGRILPGQTIKEGIAAELKEVYGYTGRFDYENIYFREYAKDRKGNDIERYAVTITLFPSHDDTLQS